MNFINKLYTSRGVVLEMLESRGYNTSGYENYTIKEIDNMHKNMPSKFIPDNMPLDIVCKHKEHSGNIYVKYIYSSKIRIHNIQTLVEDMKDSVFENDNDVLIIIIKDKISNEVILDSQLDSLYKKTGIFTQIFWLDKLVINITKHELVPSHRIISEENKKSLLVKFDINSYNQLPIILKTDPVAKFIGMKRGDVCEIKRPSETSGEYIYYRLCQ